MRKLVLAVTPVVPSRRPSQRAGGTMHRLVGTTLAAVAVSMALVTGTAGADSAKVVTGTFPIDDHFVIEPESTTCGFPITLDHTGTGRFEARLDAQGLNQRVNVHEHVVGTLSANGITLRDFVSDNIVADFRTLTMKEVGLGVRDSFLDGGVVIMDRGHLLWNFDPSTGEMVGDPIFEAGQHPDLDGDIGALCAALTP
jgi:hypothetical protein